MKYNKLVRLIIIVLLLLNLSAAYGQSTNDVYVIPVKGEINKATYQFMKAKLDEISRFNAAAIIFEIDTYGGLIVEAEKIKDLIINQEAPTISFINTKAESAGVLISISSEKIAMAEGATIGSAETIPNTEKILSTWVSILRSVAEQRGRNPDIIASMADKDIEIDGIVEKGELLNLNYKEAEDLGITDVIANNYEDILESFNIEYNQIITIDTDFKTKIAGAITNPYISSLLLSLAFIGLIVEVLTPGFGAGGTISFIAFSLYFGGNILAGNSQWAVIIVFIAGIALLLIEAAIPGFGIPGIGGILCVILSIILASGSIETAIISLGVAIVLTALTGALLIKYGYRSPYLDKIILKTSQDRERGYSSIITRENYVGREGIVITTLRPAGTIEIEGNRVDAVSEGDFINKGERVKVLKIEGPKVVVRKISR